MIEKISLKQFAILSFMNIIGTSIIFIPTVAANFGKQDAWIIVLIATVIGFFVISLYSVLSLKSNGKSFFELLNRTCGKWFGSIIIIIFISYIFLNIIANLWTISQFIAAQILVGTPSGVIIFIILFTTVIAVRSGLEVITRTMEVFFPFIVLSLVLLCVFVLPEIKAENIFPVFQTDKSKLFIGGISILSFTFLELVILLGVMDQVNHTEKIKKYFLIGTLSGSLIIMIVTLLCIMVLGVDATSDYTYPIYVLGQKINIATIIQRIEGIAAFIWFFTNFFKICTSYYVLLRGMQHVLKMKDYKVWTIPVAYLIFSGAYNGYRNAYFDFDHTTYVPITIIAGVILPILILLATIIKKNNGQSNKT
ncbi:endospore germination permease [Paraliobacillus sp. JSM ZJ581]|uniref:GerAB/ArcD/ProY family transporter n=1 Tax=Paraliobacillus sp. JSM ZJ581 TaxID=3342118 RepID=UPI0035A8EB54